MNSIGKGLVDQQLSILNNSVNIPLKTLVEKIHSSDNDIVFLSGTLIEGIGTESSDFDFYVICEHRMKPNQFPLKEHHRFFVHDDEVTGSFDYMEGYDLAIDVEYKTTKEIYDILKYTKDLYHFLYNRTKVYPFNSYLIDDRFIYRLFHAIPVKNIAGFEALKAGLDKHEVCYSAYRSCVGSYPDFRDIVGCWREKDFSTAVLMTRKWAFDNVRGFTHLHGNVNKNQKYLLKYVRALPEQYKDLKEKIEKLATSGAESENDQRDYIIEWVDTIDTIFDLSRDLLDRTPRFPSREHCREVVAKEISSNLHWHIELSREFGYRNRVFMDGLPPLREFLEEKPKSSFAKYLEEDPFRRWAKENPTPFGGENLTFS